MKTGSLHFWDAYDSHDEIERRDFLLAAYYVTISVVDDCCNADSGNAHLLVKGAEYYCDRALQHLTRRDPEKKPIQIADHRSLVRFFRQQVRFLVTSDLRDARGIPRVHREDPRYKNRKDRNTSGVRALSIVEGSDFDFLNEDEITDILAHRRQLGPEEFALAMVKFKEMIRTDGHAWAAEGIAFIDACLDEPDDGNPKTLLITEIQPKKKKKGPNTGTDNSSYSDGAKARHEIRLSFKIDRIASRLGWTRERTQKIRQRIVELARRHGFSSIDELVESPPRNHIIGRVS